MAEPITSFRGPQRFLSNFYPCVVFYEGLVYPTTEHAYHAAKFTDPATRKLISEAPSPGRAKVVSYELSAQRDMSFDERRQVVMLDLLRLKFSQAEFRAMLLATGDAHIEEGNNHGDRYWGTVDGEGENHLGRLIMNVRDELKAESAAMAERKLPR